EAAANASECIPGADADADAARDTSIKVAGHVALYTSTTTVDGGEFTVTLTESSASSAPGTGSGAGRARSLHAVLQLAAAWAIAVPIAEHI
ncbi:hypothetical protein LPJ61_005873, partial [Coemansia biformis]